jgi:hypothetical protein
MRNRVILVFVIASAGPILSGCAAAGPIRAADPKQIPAAGALRAPIGFVDDPSGAAGVVRDGAVVHCVGDQPFGCNDAIVSRYWRTANLMPSATACERFATWSIEHGLNTFNYATYTNGDQQWHTMNVPSTGSPQFSAFVKQCTLYGDGGANATGTPTDALRPSTALFNQDGPVKNSNASLYWTIIVEY